jgi:hypothetical protein
MRAIDRPYAPSGIRTCGARLALLNLCPNLCPRDAPVPALTRPGLPSQARNDAEQPSESDLQNRGFSFESCRVVTSVVTFEHAGRRAKSGRDEERRRFQRLPRIGPCWIRTSDLGIKSTSSWSRTVSAGRGECSPGLLCCSCFPPRFERHSRHPGCSCWRFGIDRRSALEPSAWFSNRGRETPATRGSRRRTQATD